jgi:acyl-CoA dehydrogenase
MKSLERVLNPGPSAAFADADDFWRVYVADAAVLEAPIDRALAGGALADRLGYAFLAGYSAALHALVPAADPAAQRSLAATEEGGAHPKAIRCRLERRGDGWSLSGTKSWVTLASGELLVLASRGESEEGRSQLVLVRVGAQRPGVRRLPQPALPFVPEVLHAQVVLEAVPVTDADLLPGDGWERWVKPFRTVEDVHVNAAVLAYLGATAGRHGWPRPLREELAASLLTFHALAGMEPSSPETHVALGGALAQARRQVEACDPHWSSAPGDERARWERDRPLLEVAGKARQLRLARAWERLGR